MKYNRMFGLFSIVTAVMLVLASCSSDAYANTFKVVSDGEVGVYYVGSSAGYENQASATFSDSNELSPIVSNRGATGEYFSFGYHEAGSTVVFSDHIIDTGDWFYSTDSFNDDGLRHIQYGMFTMHEGTPYSTPVTLVGFEDLMGGGDLDFNDHVLAFTNISAVPEPETYVMLLLGLGLIGVFSRRT